MKIKFERIYGENRIGDVVEFEKGEELNYILTILETEKEEKETSENNSEIAKNGKTKKK